MARPTLYHRKGPGDGVFPAMNFDMTQAVKISLLGVIIVISNDLND
jgi:hypothetical protein